MRILVYSDVHGNLPAFEKILKDIGICDMYLCLGDLVNYGPWSNECVDLAISLPNSIILKGNHEEAYLNKKYEGTNTLVKNFFNHTIEFFDRFDVIEMFMESYSLLNFYCTHTLLNKYIYPDTSLSLDKNYFIGHSHHQFMINSNGFRLYNPGSVGQNRAVINLANYIIFETDSNHIDFMHSKIDIRYLISKMESENYPQDCIQYYKNKPLF